MWKTDATGLYGDIDYAYDAAGNVTDDDRGPGQDYDLTYDDRSRLTKLTKNGLTQTHYTLNGSGERVSKLQAGSTAHYHYDAGGALLAESDDLDQIASCRTRRVHQAA